MGAWDLTLRPYVEAARRAREGHASLRELPPLEGRFRRRAVGRGWEPSAGHLRERRVAQGSASPDGWQSVAKGSAGWKHRASVLPGCGRSSKVRRDLLSRRLHEGTTIPDGVQRL